MPAKSTKKSTTTTTKKSVKKSGTRTRKPKRSFKSYIHRTLKEAAPDRKISKRAMLVMLAMVNDVYSRVAQEAQHLRAHKKTATLSASDVLDAAKLVLGNNIFSEVDKSFTRAKAKAGM